MQNSKVVYWLQYLTSNEPIFKLEGNTTAEIEDKLDYVITNRLSEFDFYRDMDEDGQYEFFHDVIATVNAFYETAGFYTISIIDAIIFQS